MSANWGDGDGMNAGGPPAIPVSSAPAPAPAPAPSGPRQYKRMVLAKRTVAAPAAAATTQRSSIFGAAKPREQVLREKGIDVKAVERRLNERTQRLPRMNKQQEEEFLELEAQLKAATAKVASEEATVDEKAEAEKDVAKLTAERAAFIAAREKEEIEFSRKRREQQRAEEAAGGGAGGAFDAGRDRDSSGGRSGGGGQYARRDNNNGGDFSNFESNRNRGGDRDRSSGGAPSYGGSFGGRSTGGGFSGGRGSSEGKLFVGQLDFATTSESLQTAFAPFGALGECTVITDRQTGESKGFGFVKFQNPADAATAMQALNGTQVDGRSISIKPAQ